MTIKMISAVSTNGIIGKNNSIPWSFDKYPADMKFFRQTTANSTIIMGRLTYESIGSKPLPKRRNIVITRSKLDHVECYDNLDIAIERASIQELCETSPPPLPIWLIGGTGIYRNGMKYASEIFLTLIPEAIEGENLTTFPWIDPTKFNMTGLINLENSELKVAHYVKY